MATVNPTITWIGKRVAKVQWDNLGATSADDVGAAAHVAGFSSVTIQALGTFGSSTTTIQGSNDSGTTYATLNDSRGEGNALTFTAADVRRVDELPQQIRPLLSSGAGASVTVVAVCRAEA